MDNKRKISIIIPVFNEANNLEPLYKEIFDVMQSLQEDFEIIFVNDGSTDSTQKNLFIVLRY